MTSLIAAYTARIMCYIPIDRCHGRYRHGRLIEMRGMSLLNNNDFVNMVNQRLQTKDQKNMSQYYKTADSHSSTPLRTWFSPRKKEKRRHTV